MVFFNYSTMQMAAKVVYYGPGLCGKTTNLHHIYSQTSSECRGEMVSLETETDRTLFFDLLPIDVGQIAGFNTRIQLYTVPGQVFYNTTRKLVLKGVDGVVFVADSQRAMLAANIESLKNLEENLAEMGLSIKECPIVLQFNKRDLAEICTVEELNRALNPKGWPHFEAAALHGKGVFETLKGISKLTLISLKQRLVGNSGEVRTPTRPAPTPAPPAASAPAPKAAAPASAPPVAAAPPPAAAVQKSAGKAAPRDVLSELERLRQTVRTPLPKAPETRPASPPVRPPAAVAVNGSGELHRDIQLTLPRADFLRARRFSVTLQVEDDERRVVESVRNLEVELGHNDSIDKILLRLNIALAAKP
jgi:signal recognition particle receptor subunit beta